MLKITSIQGKNINTHTKEITIPLARANPRSGPISNCITHNAKNPIVTVQAEEIIAVEDLQSAEITFSSGLRFLPHSSAKLRFPSKLRSSANLCIRKTLKSSEIANCKIVPAAFATNEISPKMRFVPPLIATTTPSSNFI